jgi:hypothetical protein
VIMGSFSHVWVDPEGCCCWLNEGGAVHGVYAAVLVRQTDLLILKVKFDPPPELRLPGFPAERIHISLNSSREIAVVPEDGSGRLWLHKYPRQLPTAGLPLVSLVGGLCLWYPDDPPHLKWAWDAGIDEYLRIVQRHLWNEEFWRRFSYWPTEDTPHGLGFGGKPHPILDPMLQRPR